MGRKFNFSDDFDIKCRLLGYSISEVANGVTEIVGYFNVSLDSNALDVN